MSNVALQSIPFLLFAFAILGQNSRIAKLEKKYNPNIIGCHHVWDKWELCEIFNGWKKVGEERVEHFISGQQRDCTFCGERQIKKLEP